MNLFVGLTHNNPINNNNNDLFSSLTPINNNNNDLFSSLTGNSNTNTINISSQYSPYQII